MGRPANEEGLRWTEKAMALQMTHHAIIREGAPKFEVTERTVRRWIEAVYGRMEKQSEAAKPMRRHQMVVSLQMVYQLAVKAGDLRAAIAALDRISRIYGIYEDQLTIRGTVGLGVGLSTLGFKDRQEVLDRTEELKERLASGGSKAAKMLEASSSEKPAAAPGPGAAAQSTPEVEVVETKARWETRDD